MNNLHDLYQISKNFASTPKMPVLFLGHGSPMNAIVENEFVTGFRNLALSLPKPRAIICVSAHWFTQGTKVTAMATPPTIHDFSGFPPALNKVQYPASGSPQLAHLTKELLLPTPVAMDEQWGLDHGTWSVVKHLYPQANIPVIQLSIDYTMQAAEHFDLAKQLGVLRNKGILIMGSGNMIHNLRLVDFQNFDKENYGYDWAWEANEILHQCLRNGDYQPLLHYEKQGKALQLAIPTPEHFLPLIYALGLQQKDDKMELFNDKLVAGSLSMTSIKLS